jgi:hypothetical protein
MRSRFNTRSHALLVASITLVGTIGACSSDCPKGTVASGSLCKYSEKNANADSARDAGSADEAAAADAGRTSSAHGGKAGASSGASDAETPAMHGAAGTAGAADGGTGGSPSASGASGAGGSPAVSKTCSDEGSLRCAAAGAPDRDQCTGGRWTTGPACAAGQVCTGKASCSPVNDHCRGSGGQAVCDGTGNLLLCDDDATLSAKQTCMSESHCQAGLANRKCAICIPNQEHNCTGTTLGVCAADGQSFMKVTDCQTAALCNKMLGACTTAVCEPNKAACQGDNLTMCNSDGTAIASMTRCNPGMCDKAGGDCNQCNPGEKKCADSNVMTCNAQGQGYDPSPCPNNGKCVGMGQCVACSVDSDCSSMTTNSGCKVGYCANARCATKNAADNTKCNMLLGAGVCSVGSCIGCPNSAYCAANSPLEPVCDPILQTCGQCSGSTGCTAGKVCSLYNTCIDDTSTPRANIITSCSAGCASGSCSGGYPGCTPACHGDPYTDCPAGPGGRVPGCGKYKVDPSNNQYCMYSCSVNSDCPAGSTCAGTDCVVP